MSDPSHARHAVLWACLILASCGGGGGASDDTAVDDGTPADTLDLTDPGVDPLPDTPADTSPDSAEDPPGDTAEEDTPGDHTGDHEGDMPGDGSGEDMPVDCEGRGGYCTTYPVVPDTCVVCDDVGGVHYQPARESWGALGCTSGGIGATPWCCLPVDMTAAPTCVLAGGACYPHGTESPCAVGWATDGSLDCPGGQTCCMPGASCS